jgi:hypothetical protein
MTLSFSATTPQHHLIIRVEPHPTALSNEGDILLAYGVTEADIEPAVLALARRQGIDGMRRAARLAATNRALSQYGFNQLLISSEPTGSEPNGSEPNGSEPNGSEPNGSEPNGNTLLHGMKLVSDDDIPLCKDELCSMAAIGLNEPEYRSIKGTAGIVLDLHVDRLAYFKIKALCKKHSKPQGSILRYARMRLQKKKRNSKLSV